MKCNTIVKPVDLPAIFGGDLFYDHRQPFRPWSPKLRNIHIFGGEPKIARQHQRGTVVDRDLQLCSRLCRRPADLIERIKQRIAVKRFDHANSAPSARIIGMKSGKLVAIKAVSSTLTGLSAANPITSADIAMR